MKGTDHARSDAPSKGQKVPMVVIRLSRAGTKKKPFYRVVVADQRNPRDGRFIEQLGTYDPRKDAHGLSLRLDRVDHWVGTGAQPSETVGHLILKAKAATPAA
jgi:small subunit ribosomal protein S16